MFAKSQTGTAQKTKFSVKDFVTFTEEIRNGKLHFLCSVGKNTASYAASPPKITY